MPPSRIPLTKSSLTSDLTWSHDNVIIERSLCGDDGDEGEPRPAGAPPCAAPDRVHSTLACSRNAGRSRCTPVVYRACLSRSSTRRGLSTRRHISATDMLRTAPGTRAAFVRGRQRAAARQGRPALPRRRRRRLPPPHLNGLFSLKQIINFLLVKGIIHNLFSLHETRNVRDDIRANRTCRQILRFRDLAPFYIYDVMLFVSSLT